MEKDKSEQDTLWHEVSKIIVTNKKTHPINRKIDVSIQVVDVPKVIEVLKSRFTIHEK